MKHPKFRLVERQARRMHELMDRLKVDAGKLVRLEDGAAYARARTRCLDCDKTENCLKWLEALEDTAAQRPDFCANLELFESCSARQELS